MTMMVPDFASTDLTPLEERDLKFLIENFPNPGRNYSEIAQVIGSLPNTIESMLNSDYVFEKILDRSALLLNVSPFLLFNVLLRKSVDDARSACGRQVVNYVANLLSLFAHSGRLFRIQDGDLAVQEYVFDMIAQSSTVDTRRQFLIYSHIGNYSLYVTGLFSPWIDYRFRYKNRPVDIKFFVQYGRAYFDRASNHVLASRYGLVEVFSQLAAMFDHYRQALDHMARHYLVLGH